MTCTAVVLGARSLALPAVCSCACRRSTPMSPFPPLGHVSGAALNFSSLPGPGAVPCGS
jgi:hypothetical protein